MPPHRALLAFLAAAVPLPLHATAAEDVRLISATDPADLKAVFFSGTPWLVQCATKAELATAAGEGPAAVLHQAVRLALSALPREASVGVLDCRTKLPSGKNTIDRFGLDGNASPVLFAVANAKKPLQISADLLLKYTQGAPVFPSPRQQAAALASLFAAKTEPKAMALTKTEHLHTACLKKKHCAVLLLAKPELRGDQNRMLAKLMNDFRTVSFVTINMANYRFSLANKLPEPTPAAPQLLVVYSQANAEDKRKASLAAKAHRGAFTLAELRAFMQSFVNQQLELTPLQKAPQLAWRKQAGKEGSSQSASATGPSGSMNVKVGGNGRMVDPPGQGASSVPGRKGGNAARKGGSASRGKAQEDVGDAASREAKQRQKMAEEEEAYLRGMYEDAEEGSTGEVSEESEVLDFDEEEFDGGADNSDKDEI